MATATIVTAYKDATLAHVHAQVSEGGQMGTVEYRASVSLVDAQGNAKTVAQIKADLVAELTAIRNRQIGGTVPLPTITGTVTV